MTPRTRTSNRDTTLKVYHSKKVPQQVHFPHKRKTVRRPETAEQDGAVKRQMKFLPERMRQTKIQVEDELEDEETDDETVVQEAVNEKTLKVTPQNRRSKKRKSDDAREGSVSDNEDGITSSKRRRRTAKSQEGPSRMLRRQSTMTQLADGRRPSIDADEPDFKPIKRRSRVSRTGASLERERDKKQRTLTQMVPGIGRLSKEELDELSDLEAEIEDDQAENGAVSQSLIEQGLLDADTPTKAAASMQLSGDLPFEVPEQPAVAVQSVETTAIDDSEEDYQPTQFIEAPSRRTRRTRWTTTKPRLSKTETPTKAGKSRFSLLSTPEKRRIFEIPSSQSPSESILSTQTSPQKSNRSTLRERTRNTTVVTDTPSKRRQVTFQEPPTQPAPPARLRKFKSTIQDSEDEQGSDIEEDLATQDRLGYADHTAHSPFIGADTQAMLNQMDRSRANALDNMAAGSRESSDEPEEAAIFRGGYRPSPELGESWAPVIYDDDGPDFDSYRSAPSGSKSQSFGDVDSPRELLPVFHQRIEVSQLDMTTQALVPAANIPSTPPTIQLQPYEDPPSTPMVIRDESSGDEEAGLESTPPRRIHQTIAQAPPTLVHQSTDLDGEPVQVPRSPSVDRETQQSHSSKAEQQLQNEWLSYSQYIHARVPNSSSMHAAADAFSYNATPRLPKTGTFAVSSTRIQHSQATTVDEVTPKKNRTQRVVSANVTPHRTSKTQPFVSPEKPPSLFIPSSFPSPSRTAMEGWSSPVMAKTQNLYGSSQVLGSLEDFSIPLPPPMEDERES